MTLLLNIVLFAFVALFLIDFSNMLRFAWVKSKSQISKTEVAVSTPQDPWINLYEMKDEVAELTSVATAEELKSLPLLTTLPEPIVIPQTSRPKMTKTQINKLGREELIRQLSEFEVYPVGNLKELRNMLKRKMMLE